jgi:hypothetical protein
MFTLEIAGEYIPICWIVAKSNMGVWSDNKSLVDSN